MVGANDSTELWRYILLSPTNWMKGSGCVAQLVERSFPIPEVRGSNPAIGKNLFIMNITFVYCQMCNEKTKIKKKRPGMAHF